MKSKFFTMLFVLCILISAGAEEQFLYDSKGKRDPFVPLVGVTAKSVESLQDVVTIEDVDLQGIAYDAKGKLVAIINGEMVRVGEGGGRLIVKDISDDSVILSIDDEEYKLNIYEEK